MLPVVSDHGDVFHRLIWDRQLKTRRALYVNGYSDVEVQFDLVIRFLWTECCSHVVHLVQISVSCMNQSDSWTLVGVF